MGSKQLFVAAACVAALGVGLFVLGVDKSAQSVVSAQTLSSELDVRLREAVTAMHSRIETLAALPSLHDSVSTDAETVRDQTQRERSFQPRAGETITIAQIPNVGAPVVLLVMPAGGAPIDRVSQEGARFSIVHGALEVAEVVFVTPSEASRAAELKGALGIQAEVPLSSWKERLDGIGAQVRFVIEGEELRIGAAKPARGEVVFPLTLTGPIGERLRVTATMPQVGSGLLPRVLGGLAMLASVVLGLLAARLRRHPDLESKTIMDRSDLPTLAVPVGGGAEPSAVHAPVIVEGSIIDGTYEVTRLLGQGGMGTVWEARHMRLPDKRVAIKILTIEGQTEDHVSRFRREADVTSKLGHPNIVGVLDFNTLPMGAPYIVLEFLEGETLAARIHRGAIPLDEAIEITKQIASALHAAHEAGIVHRDLKPENVFLVPTGRGDEQVKVLDFGISKIRGNVLMQTQDALVFGTPQYMSPEQARGKNSEVDARTDVWALGTIVHEMLTGTPAFAGDTLTSFLVSVVEHPSPSLRGQQGVPDHVADAVDQALAKDPQDRWADMPSFLAALTGSPAQRLD